MALQYSEDESSDSSSAYNIDTYGGEFGYGFPFTDEAKYYIYAAYEKIGIRNVDTLEKVEKGISTFCEKTRQQFGYRLTKAGFVA